MKTKTIDASHLLVILTEQESRSLGLNADHMSWSSLHCRLTIARLFAVACAGTNFAADKEQQITIKAMSTADGECVLMFSTDPSTAHKRKIYKVKTSARPYIYQFCTAGDVLNAIERLFHAKMDCSSCQLLQYNGGYQLVLCPRCTNYTAMDCILKEYGTLAGKGTTAAAFSAEHGKLLCNNAIHTVGSYLS